MRPGIFSSIAGSPLRVHLLHLVLLDAAPGSRHGGDQEQDGGDGPEERHHLRSRHSCTLKVTWCRRARACFQFRQAQLQSVITPPPPTRLRRTKDQLHPKTRSVNTRLRSPEQRRSGRAGPGLRLTGSVRVRRLLHKSHAGGKKPPDSQEAVFCPPPPPPAPLVARARRGGGRSRDHILNLPFQKPPRRGAAVEEESSLMETANVHTGNNKQIF